MFLSWGTTKIWDQPVRLHNLSSHCMKALDLSIPTHSVPSRLIYVAMQGSWILAGLKFCCALVQFVFSMFQVTKYESSCSVYVTSVYSLPSGISLSCSVCSCKYQMSHNTQKHVFRDFRPGKIQTSLLSYRSSLESWNFGYSKYTYHTI